MESSVKFKFLKYFSDYRQGGKVIVGIKPNNYYSGLDQILQMAEIAKTDFPQLELADIHTVAYDGDRWKRITGIEFSLPADTPIAEGYVEIKLEFVFAGNG